MVYTIGDEFVEGYIRDAKSMRRGCRVKVWDPTNQDFCEGTVDSRDDEGMYIRLHYDENIFLTVPNEEIFLVVREDEEDNEYIPLVTDVLAKRAKAAALAKALRKTDKFKSRKGRKDIVEKKDA